MRRGVASEFFTKRPAHLKAIAALFVALLCAAAVAAEKAPLNAIQTIPLPGVKGRFDHFSIDAKGKRLFVAALGNNTLEVIDLAAGSRSQSVAGMSKPCGVLYLAEKNQIAVANGDDGTLKLLDATTLKVLRSRGNVPDADNVRFDGDSKLCWLGYGDGALGLIDLAAPKVVATIELSGHPESFQLEKQGSRIFVNLPDTKQIAVVDRIKRAVIGTWPMQAFQANFPMALDEPNQRLFVGCRKPDRLVVLNTHTGKPVADVAIGGDTDDLFFDAQRKRIYVSCGEGAIDTVSQESPDSYKPLARVRTAPGARTSFFSPELDRLYLAVPERGNQKAEIRVYQPQL